MSDGKMKNTIGDVAELRPITVPMDGAMQMPGLARRTIQRLVAEKRLPMVKIGRKVLFRVSALESLIASMESGSNDGEAA